MTLLPFFVKLKFVDGTTTAGMIKADCPIIAAQQMIEQCTHRGELFHLYVKQMNQFQEKVYSSLQQEPT